LSPTIRIRDDGREHTLTYEGLLAYHGGGAMAGASAGFRVMQAAAAALANERPWERRGISMVSGHPGPGYRDAFEYVTRCVTRDRFTLDRDLPGGRHSPYQHYAFQFQIDDDNAGRRATITLREGIVPMRLFEVLRDIKTGFGEPGVERELAGLKAEIAEDVMSRSLDELFEIEVTRPE